MKTNASWVNIYINLLNIFNSSIKVKIKTLTMTAFLGCNGYMI